MSTSDYKSDALEAKEKLKQVSPTMCLAKWNQTSLHLPTGLTNSCYHPPLHKIDPRQLESNPAALHNTTEKLDQRFKMLQGERPDGCSYCWKLEDTGEMSDRHYRSGEPWAMQDFEQIRKNPMTTSWTPRYVEVNFNNACNFKCSYCSPQFSTTWAKEVDRYGEYPTSPPHNAPEHFQGRRKPIPHREDNPYVTAFWKWWPTLYKNLKHFRMTGGEPMMDKNTYKVFQYIIDNPKDDLHLNVTSNMCPPDKKLKTKYFNMLQTICMQQKVEHVMQFVSVDAWAKQAEYIRFGLDFNRMWDNVDEFLERIPQRNSVTFIITYNNLSVVSMRKLLEGILELRKRHSKTYQRVWFDIPLLRAPLWQCIQVMPQHYEDYLEECIAFMELNQADEVNIDYRGFKDFEIDKVRRNLAWMKEGRKMSQEELTKARANFYKFFTQHDTRRNTDFLATFSEMEDWWNICKEADALL